MRFGDIADSGDFECRPGNGVGKAGQDGPDGDGPVDACETAVAGVENYGV